MRRNPPPDVVLANKRDVTPPPFTHDRLGRPLIGPCLIWNGKLPKDGYPRINYREIGSSPQLVHRVAYALAHAIPFSEIGQIPVLDHLCRRPACSAAAHLEPTTRRENIARGNPNQNERREACIQGHPLAPPNLYIRTGGTRACRECKRRMARESWRRKNRPDLVGKPPTIDGRPQSAELRNEPKPRRNWSDGT